MKPEKTILLTNDDGIHAPGLQIIRNRLAGAYEVITVAPDRERSAVSMGITLTRPLRIRRESPDQVAVDGTPSDCINLGLQAVMSNLPDLVVSGMNQGENLSYDVFYSGTVGAAFTAHLYGLPALAVSMIPTLNDAGDLVFDFVSAADLTADVIRRLLPVARKSVVYNLNIPNGAKKVRVTSLGDKRYHPEVVETRDPRGHRAYWLGTGRPEYHGDGDSDVITVQEGDASLSILLYDLNAADECNHLKAVFS
ncbi:MAG TPA: 5'/3'-nucleotidase SurE [Candidatus Aminicenantes bacterium]|nr:5'/3'-nucleotidase SurE [Candidatus Aminicenantes bacterium]